MATMARHVVVAHCLAKRLIHIIRETPREMKNQIFIHDFTWWYASCRWNPREIFRWVKNTFFPRGQRIFFHFAQEGLGTFFDIRNSISEWVIGQALNIKLDDILVRFLNFDTCKFWLPVASDIFSPLNFGIGSGVRGGLGLSARMSNGGSGGCSKTARNYRIKNYHVPNSNHSTLYRYIVHLNI